MPFTPFHFGPGIAIKAALPRYFSFAVFCFTQVAIDCEVACYLIRGQYPIHRWCHTYFGATFVAVACALIGRPVCQFLLRCWLAWADEPLKRLVPATANIFWRSAFASAFLGTYSHVLLDSIMHYDMRPFFPFSDGNPLYRGISLLALHALCVVLGIAGAWRVIASHRNSETRAQA
jgi:hypothetical protein